MEIEEALHTYLLTRTGLTALLGTDSDGDYKLYDDEAPQGTTLPYITCMQTGAGISNDLQGELDFEEPAYQWTVYASSKLGAKAIGRQIKAAFKNFRGVLSGLNIQWIERINDITGKARINESTSCDTEYLEYRIHYDYQ
jgi:hypothetical protein